MDEEEYLLCSLNFSFKGIRCIENTFITSNWKAKFQLYFKDERSQIDLLQSVNKLRYFFNQILDDSIIFNVQSDFANFFFTDGGEKIMGNNYMMLPFDPTDDFLGIILCRKINSFIGVDFLVGGVEIESDNALNLSFQYFGNGDAYFNEIEGWHNLWDAPMMEAPWWERNDATTYDIPKGDESWIDDFTSLMTNNLKTTNIIKTNFKVVE